MSVITESLENDPIVIIANFVACEDGTEFDWELAREFEIGEVVYFIDFFKDSNTKQEYLQWFIKFRTKEGKLYSATQRLFVCAYEWQEIVEYIKTNYHN
ncbi:MAG: hypothetical protein K0S76_3166 [Herbinix sp.]|jgi:hypothetical protein|nr:hypothetical protein [Herbinix sp.]